MTRARVTLRDHGCKVTTRPEISTASVSVLSGGPWAAHDGGMDELPDEMIELLLVVTRLVDALDDDDRAALLRYLIADPSPRGRRPLFDVLTTCAYDLDQLALDLTATETRPS